MDDLFDQQVAEARTIIARTQRASVSLLQRQLGVGYSRGNRIMESLMDAGVVGTLGVSIPRAVLVDEDGNLKGAA